MLKDKKLIWVMEYVIAFILLAAVMPFIVHPQPGWSDAHGWAYLLFIACSSMILISSASTTRQNMKLAGLIAKLEQISEGLKSSQKQASNQSGQKRTADEPRHVGIGSVN